MDKAMPNLHFELMALAYKFRDRQSPRMNTLNEVGIKAGSSVLDYGCGPGSYINPLLKLVGESGRVYALDVHPLAVKKVRTMALKKGLSNVATIQSDCKSGLQNNSVDVVLLYDIFHDLSKPDEVLEELHRILKPDGILSFNDHHMRESEILSGVTSTGLFELQKKGQRTYTFSPKEADSI